MASKRDRVSWKGYLPAITTPFDDERRLDLRALGGLLEWLHAEGMHGLVVAGTAGEWFSLDTAERHALFHAAGNQLARRLPLIAGCSAYTPGEVLTHIDQAHAAGFSGVLVTPPPYARSGEEDILAFFTAIAQRSRLPICVYNWPPGTGIDMPLALLERIADLDAVVAMKQSTGDMAQFIASFFALHEKVRVFGLPLDEFGLMMVRLHDADGTIGAGGVLGHHHPDFYNRAWQGDFAGALTSGRKDRMIMREWFTPALIGKFGSAAAILKSALNARGVPGGRVRAPFQDVSAANAASIAATMETLGCLSGPVVAARERALSC